MKSHLLSIFPLRDEKAYARLTITEVEDTHLPQLEPSLINRDAVVAILTAVGPSDAAELLMTDLDDGLPVQVTISAEEAFAAVPLIQNKYQ